MAKQRSMQTLLKILVANKSMYEAYECTGLCSLVYRLRKNSYIDGNEYERLINYITTNRPKRGKHYVPRRVLLYPVIDILLQNMQFDNSDCIGYHEKEESDKVIEIHNVLISISKYYKNNAAISWVINEVSIILSMIHYYSDESNIDYLQCNKF